MVHQISEQNSILHQYLLEIRSQDIQKDSMRFRRNLERIGEILAYEMSKSLQYEQREIHTPLADCELTVPKEFPVLTSILRAGMPMHNGVLNYFDHSDNGFISAYRRYHRGGDFEIELEYASAPDLTDKEVVIIDPMIATGSSMLLVYRALLKFGTPKRVHLLSAIASQIGIAHLKAHLPNNTQIWTAAIDNELTAKGYIVPGLGDAGDLAYGPKK